jgi:cell division protein FtsA
VERETFVGIDVGTTKVVALIGEVGRDGALTIIGKGIVPASGLRKGIVVNIDQTVHSISAAIEKAERHAGYKIERAFVGVGGQHVEGLNSPGQVAVAGPRREVAQEDVNRSIEVARAVSIPSTREVLHVIPRGYTVDGQEGVMNPLGMSAVRLEVVTHIVTASATAVQNLTKCVTAADVKIDELVAAGLASAEAVLSPTSAPGRSTSPSSSRARPSTPPSSRSAARTSRTTSRSGSRPAFTWPKRSRSITAPATSPASTPTR